VVCATLENPWSINYWDPHFSTYKTPLGGNTSQRRMLYPTAGLHSWLSEKQMLKIK